MAKVCFLKFQSTRQNFHFHCDSYSWNIEINLKAIPYDTGPNQKCRRVSLQSKVNGSRRLQPPKYRQPSMAAVAQIP